MMISTYSCSTTVTTSSDTKPIRRLWQRILQIFWLTTREEMYHHHAPSDTSINNKFYQRRQPRQLGTNIASWKERQPHATPMIPPYSPTYCQPDQFPYSNFYVKLPDDRWMVRYRDGNRAILRTDIVDGNCI